MYNPVTSRVVITCDVIWLGRMYYTREVSHNLDKKMPVVSVPIIMNKREVKDDSEPREVVTSTTAPVSKEKEGTKNGSSEKSGNWVTNKTRFGRKVGRKELTIL